MISGCNGTIGSQLYDDLKNQQFDCFCWDRKKVTPFEEKAVSDYLTFLKPDVIYHLAIASKASGVENESWRINYQWPVLLSRLSAKLDICFIFTSTVMVFTAKNQGPYTVDSLPDEKEGYGYEKRKAEKDILDLNNQAIIARLGWQIGHITGSNNMVDFLEKQMNKNGVIKASDKWLPSCSFLEDTSCCLSDLQNRQSGIYLVNSNQKWSFYQIAVALNKKHGMRWIIEQDNSFIYDQRMFDERIHIPFLEKSLPELEG